MDGQIENALLRFTSAERYRISSEIIPRVARCPFHKKKKKTGTKYLRNAGKSTRTSVGRPPSTIGNNY